MKLFNTKPVDPIQFVFALGVVAAGVAAAFVEKWEIVTASLGIMAAILRGNNAEVKDESR